MQTTWKDAHIIIFFSCFIKCIYRKSACVVWGWISYWSRWGSVHSPYADTVEESWCMIRCISVDSAFPGKHGKTQTYSIIRIHIVDTAPQSRPVWAYSRALMMPRPLANCWVLAARTNINGSTCKHKLHRGATELTALSGYPEHNMNTCMCVEKQSTSGANAYRFP